ncbi:F-box/LRR-repeat protein [Striga hermonthica]|uniref:F-box/LRR-repeat protein n=1 Tax=Striga hermonthica TaxID=68872 RepID=A0A9N7R2Q8_STRHE|nr:F-box/LRR-repeat protein [Striga hermonthica]
MEGTSTKCGRTSDLQPSPWVSADIISHLPDHIICHILSFLPTKHSVVTSTLSKRWRPIWAHVPTLDLRSGAHHPNFPATVDRILSLHVARALDSFSLYQENSADFTESDLGNWIGAAIERNVKNVHLELDSTDMVKSPQCLFSCGTLVNLRLEVCVLPTFSGPTSLPSLKKLHLRLVEYKDNNALPQLLEGCPVLEDLTVDGIAEALGQLTVRSSTLRRLELGSMADQLDCDVVVDAPGMRCLKTSECLYGHIKLISVASLVEADICFSNEMFVEYGNLYVINVLRFMKRLGDVRALKLSGSIELFPDIQLVSYYVKFSNIVRLEVAADWRIFPSIFRSAENLKVLILHGGYWNLQRWSITMMGRCTCLLYPLQTVIIREFGCAEDEFAAVRFILANTRVLKRMEIYTASIGIRPKAKSRALRRIQLLPRESVECEIELS